MRRRHQLGQRLDLAVGEAQRKPHCEANQCERNEEQRQIEPQLQRARPFGQFVIGGRDRARRLPAAERACFRIARSIEIDPGGAIDRCDRFDPLGAAAHRHLFAARQPLQRVLREGARVAGFIEAIDDCGAHRAIGHRLQNGALDHIARFGLILIDERKIGICHFDPAEDGAHVHRHRDRLIAEIELVFLVISLCQLVGILHQPARIVREPEVHPRLEQEGSEARDQQRRHRRNQREEEHQPDMQPRRAPGSTLQRHAPARQHQQRHGGNKRADKQTCDLARWQQCTIGRRIGEGGPGAGHHDQESNRCSDFDIAKQVLPPRGNHEPAPPARYLPPCSCYACRHRGAHTTGLLQSCKCKFDQLWTAADGCRR